MKLIAIKFLLNSVTGRIRLSIETGLFNAFASNAVKSIDIAKNVAHKYP